jgi:glycogen synthase
MTVDAVGGVWTYACELVRALSPAYGFVVACLGPPPSGEHHDEMRGAGALQIVSHDGALEWMNDPWSDVDRAGEWLAGLARSEGARLVHLNGYALGAIDFGVPALVVGHSCVLSWWEAVKGAPAPAEWDEYARRVRAGVHRADAVIAPTGWMLGEITRHYGPVRRACVIPNGRHAPRVRQEPKEPLALAAGRLWDEAKNIGQFVRAAAGLPWRCAVAGQKEGPAGLAADLGALAALGKLSPRAMRHAMERASIFVHPSRYEPFGLAPLEAALAGCALVLGDIPSLREVWGDAAVYTPVGDATSLRRTLEWLMEDRAARERLACAARERAAHYSPARFGAAYDTVYRGLLRPVRHGADDGSAGAGTGVPACGSSCSVTRS